MYAARRHRGHSPCGHTPFFHSPTACSSRSSAYAYYAAWRDEGILTRLNYDLTGLARVKEGGKPEPAASVIDTQSVKTPTNMPLTSQGTNAAEKIVGRRQGILTDTIGLILAVTVAAASLSENVRTSTPCRCADT